MSIVRTLVFALAAAAVAAPHALAAEDLPETGLGDAAIVADDTLGRMHGKFLPGGGVVAFGVTMTSSLQTPEVTYAAGAQVDVDLHGAPSVTSATTWSVQTEASGSKDAPPKAAAPVPLTPHPSNRVNGDIPNGSLGIVQAVQIAGDGNAVSNRGSIDVGTTALPPVTAPKGAPCSTACSVEIGGNAVGIRIAAPGASIGQTIGSNGIVQHAVVTTNGAVLANALALHVQLAPHAGSVPLPGMYGPALGH